MTGIGNRMLRALGRAGVLLAFAGSAGAATVDLHDATATFCQNGFPISDAIDSVFNTNGWAIDPQQGNNQTAVVKATTDVGSSDATRLTFQLHTLWGDEHQIGRFRLSATTSARPTYGLGSTCGDASPGGTAVWVVLYPQALSSGAGQTLTVQPDGSVLASGTSPWTDQVNFTTTTSLRGITGFRLEVFADASFPANGPGRASNGNFVLSELVLDARPVPTIPTMGEWGLALTALMLAGVAIGRLRRRD